jgi:hypothetical protein
MGGAKKKYAPRGAGLEFLHQALKSQTDECILWPFGKRKDRYGKIKLKKKTMNSHRYVCISAHGSPSAGLDARHLCGVKLCVNPRHLKWGTRSENMLDMYAHNTMFCGEKSSRSKVSTQVVSEILKSTELSYKKLAEKYGLSESQVGRIKRREQWRFLDTDFETQTNQEFSTS